MGRPVISVYQPNLNFNRLLIPVKSPTVTAYQLRLIVADFEVSAIFQRQNGIIMKGVVFPQAIIPGLPLLTLLRRVMDVKIKRRESQTGKVSGRAYVHIVRGQNVGAAQDGAGAKGCQR